MTTSRSHSLGFLSKESATIIRVLQKVFQSGSNLFSSNTDSLSLDLFVACILVGPYLEVGVLLAFDERISKRCKTKLLKSHEILVFFFGN